MFEVKDFSLGIKQEALKALEEGKVLFLPHHNFEIEKEERAFFTPAILAKGSKNVSFDLKTDKLGGAAANEKLKAMMKRYAIAQRALLETLLPSYTPHLIQGRTSFRPAEAQGRVQSPRKDDTRLHVDAFPATPVRGKRILRVFTNVNMEGRPRVWKLGEPFAEVVRKIGPMAAKPWPLASYFLKLFKVTKDKRSTYDHYMLQLHDKMKESENYQKEVEAKEVRFPPHSSWIVFTDQTSHAALSGQFLFEQTFYLPTKAQKYEDLSPLRQLELFFQKQLV